MEEQISHFKIIEEIGSGGMGVVYRARDQRLQRKVALKVLPAGALAEPMIRERLMREAQTASSLNHPHIVTVFEIHSAGDRDFIAMEFVEGRSLDRLIGEEGLTLEKALRYGIQIADGLACAHEHGVIHRDLKPQNVMITPLDDVKILDFGLAKRFAPPGYEPDADNSTLTPGLLTLTAPGVKVGTPAYMSPEQIESRAIDARSDVFSFGCLLYEMLTGVSPFHRRNAILIFKAVLSDDPQPLRALKPKLPSDLESILDHAMRKAPEQRPGSMREVLAELEKLQLTLFGTGIYSNRSGIIPAPQAPRRKVWRLPLTVAAVLVALTGVIGLVSRAPNPPKVGDHQLISTVHGLHRQASISPDGERLAFISDAAAGVPRLWSSTVTGAEPQPLDGVGFAAEHPRWFPDGNRLLVGEVAGGIWSVPASGVGSPARLVESGANASLSPDGSRLIMEREGRLWVGKSDGTDLVPLVSTPPAFFARWVRHSASISPDGRSIAYFRPEAGPFGTLWVTPLDEDKPRRVVEKAFRGGDPLWTADGEWLIFTADFSGEPSLWYVSAAGGGPERLFREGGRHTDPELSSDGRFLVFTKSGASHHLSHLQVATGDQSEIFASNREIMGPSASSDGSRIAYFSPLSNGVHLFTIELDGSGLHQVTRAPDTRNLFPQWSADGKHLYYYEEGASRTFRKIQAAGGPSFAILTDWSLVERYATVVDPQERRVAYTPLEDGFPGRLKIRELESGRERELAMVLLTPRWSPDGNSIVGSDAQERIYQCSIIETDCLFLTEGFHPRWSQDGGSISFVRDASQTEGKRSFTLWRLQLDSLSEDRIVEVSASDRLGFGYDVLPGGDVLWHQASTLSEALWVVPVE